ncbi:MULTISPECIES: dihydroneopterin aldolase [unclassified Paracoccus (in: a-proteobacteria)]|uniref:dihydroneopterin aldolase n=1 Tax=unclassified Paracoccus (in: a-proteobacteria) TaxID=2688777 RepID=UPI0021E143F4|nr:MULTISPECIES: dihydroneopterin aldolase [unclassified Paracoccus (in: a-proteobacteria)]UXU75300.1 dihydroneopterin aldolase [Paracoccus sp. SMMA_5]UXU81202.1 dihydroneopterin aldolase [Paracoccus sp. SMMA_5_TC]
MEQPDRIHLRDYIVAAEIGAFQTERGHPQRLRFNIDVELAAHVVGVNDEVDRILSYDILTAAVASGLADRRYDLLETLAEKIAAQILVHPRAAQVSVSVEKLDRIPGALGVTLVRRQARVAADSVAAPIRVIFHGADLVLPAGALALVPDDPGLPLPAGGNAREIALLALDQAAWALAGRLGLTVADSRTELDWAASEERAVVWAPARMLRDVPGVPVEPHVLAIWLAQRLGAQRLDWALPPDAPDPVVPHDIGLPVGRLRGGLA